MISKSLTFIVLTFSIAVASVNAADVTVTVTPNPTFVGETATYEIKSSIGKPEMIAFPEVAGVQWSKNSTSTGIRIANFKRTDTASYKFTANKLGTFTIPPAKIRVGNRVMTTSAVNLSVKKRQYTSNGRQVSPEDLIFMRTYFDGKKNVPEKLYLGQELKISIYLYIDDRLNVYKDQFDRERSFYHPNNYFPTLTFENVVFKDVSKKNKLNNKLLYEDEISEIVDGQRYRVFKFYTSVSGVEVGTIKGTIDHTIPIIDPNQQNNRRNRGDPFGNFFGSSRRNKIFTQPVKATIPEIRVIPVPNDANVDGDYLGLIGNWTIKLSTDKDRVSIGEDVTLSLLAKGTGNIESLIAPELELPGFRIYPPEIIRESDNVSTGTAKWVVIPLNKESSIPLLKFKTFNPDTAEFESYEFQPELKVDPALVQTETGPLVEDYSDISASTDLAKSRDLHQATDILYIKRDLNDYVRVPLWYNASRYLTVAGIVGPVCYLLVLFVATRRERLEGSLSYRRRCQALKKRGKILRSLKKASADELPVIIREDLTPYLLAVLDLPPGATNTELIEKIDDDELKTLLTQAEIGSYMPGDSTRIDAHSLLEKVKRLAVIAVAFAIPYSGYCQSPEERAALAYDQGDIETAISIYLDVQKDGLKNASILYNLGNCAYRHGDYGHAIVFYETARRLAPRDSDIIENLNFVREQLHLSPVYKRDNPVDVIHGLLDKLRPDEWLLCVGAIWVAFWITLCVCRWYRTPARVAPAMLAALFIIALASYVEQSRGTYRSNQGIITAANTPLYRLPQQAGEEKAKSVLGAGDYVSIVEKRTEWSRIRIDQAEGWVKNSILRLIW